MQMISTRKKQKSRGNVILESALVFVVFFCLLIGAFDFGQFLYIHQALVERARWAARAGISASNTTAEIRNLVIYGNTAGTGNGYFGLTTAMVTVTAYNQGTDDARTEVILTNYPYKMFAPYAAGSYSGPNIVIAVPQGFYN